MGVARNNNFMTREDQLLVAVEAGRVVRGGSVPVRLAGGRRHRPQRWRGGCPERDEGGSDFSRRLAASVGSRRRVTTQRPRCAKGMKNGSRDDDKVRELRPRRRTAALGERWTQ